MEILAACGTSIRGSLLGSAVRPLRPSFNHHSIFCGGGKSAYKFRLALIFRRCLFFGIQTSVGADRASLWFSEGTLSVVRTAGVFACLSDLPHFRGYSAFELISLSILVPVSLPPRRAARHPRKEKPASAQGKREMHGVQSMRQDLSGGGGATCEERRQGARLAAFGMFCML